MSEQALKMAALLDMLPASERDFACEVVRKLVLAWDPDFTKLTDAEAEALQSAADGEGIDAEALYRELGIDL